MRAIKYQFGGEGGGIISSSTKKASDTLPNTLIQWDQDTELQEGYTDIVTAVRYNNNSIHDLGDLVPSITSLVVNPAAISWLDFSFNDINALDDVSRYI